MNGTLLQDFDSTYLPASIGAWTWYLSLGCSCETGTITQSDPNMQSFEICGMFAIS